MTLRSTALLALVVLTSGCGLKGPLYLPEERTESAAVQTETDETERKRQNAGASAQASAGTEAVPEREER
jgi:predicted small lipoprotein YifL